jgi:hypothetical protein
MSEDWQPATLRHPKDWCPKLSSLLKESKERAMQATGEKVEVRSYPVEREEYCGCRSILVRREDSFRLTGQDCETRVALCQVSMD